jgi:signal transduction histidine kinase
MPISVIQENEQLSTRLDSALKEVDRLLERLRELEAQRHEFLHRFQHDCVNPLGSIRGFLSLLQQPQCGELNSRQRQYVQSAEKGTHSLLTLIQKTSGANSIAEAEAPSMRQAGGPEGTPQLPRN